MGNELNMIHSIGQNHQTINIFATFSKSQGYNLLRTSNTVAEM